MSTPHRVGSWTLRLGAQATTLGLAADAVYTFDLEGRPLSWWADGVVFKRSLASEVHARRGGENGRERWRLTDDEAAAAFTRLLEAARESPEAGPVDWTARRESIVRWTPQRLAAERARFDVAYAPISILPPDQYLSVVLQATFGCSWNKCTFCSFYQGTPFRARTPGELAGHLAAVRDLLGQGAGLRRSIFLADGNALVLSNERLRAVFDGAREAFPGRGFSGFVDVIAGERKSVPAWRELKGWGLTRVHVGLETGHEPLLRWMNKPGTNDETVAFVSALKEAGVGASIIVMAGAGGERFGQAHVRDTLALVARLPLGAGDLVYVSPFVEHEGSEYARRARAEGVAALSGAGTEAQFRHLSGSIRALLPGARVSRYDIREFLY